jgi:hypothetical protein
MERQTEGSISQIADMAERAQRYAALVMNEGWPEIHAMQVGQ